MSDIKLPAGAFAAAKSGAPQPTAPAAKTEAPAEPPKAEAKPAPKKPEPKPEPAAADKETPAEREKRLRKVKVRDKEVDVDLADEDAVLKQIQRGLAADDTFRTAAEAKRQAEQFIHLLKTDPRSVLTNPNIGVDLKKFAEEVVWEEIQRKQREAEWEKNPELKAQWERDQELKKYKDKEAKETADGAAKKLADETRQFEGQYEKKIITAFETGAIPRTPEALARMYHYLEQAVEHGYDLEPADLVEQIQRDYQGDVTTMLGHLSGEQLLEMLGDAAAEKLRKADLARLKSPQGAPFPGRSAAKKAAGNRPAPAVKRMSGSDWKSDTIKGFLDRKK